MYIRSTTIPTSTSSSTTFGTTTTTASNTNDMYQILLSTGSGSRTCYSPATSHGLGILIGSFMNILLLVYYSGSTHATWKDHSRRTVHAATIKDSRPGHVFHSLYFYCLENGGLLDWVDNAFLGGTNRFEKQRWRFGLWEGGPLLFSVWNQNPRCLFALRGREEPKHQQQQHEDTTGGHTCRNIADLACFNHWPLGDRDIQGQGHGCGAASERMREPWGDEEGHRQRF